MVAGEMDQIAARYRDRGVTSVFVYTREAHPGENLRHHQTLSDKRENARAFKEQCGVLRPILIDALDGPAHRGYGLLPNMSFIVAPNGLLLYKAAWTVPEDIEDALKSALDSLARRRAARLRPAYTERVAWRENDQAAFRAGLKRAGPQAVKDFFGK